MIWYSFVVVVGRCMVVVPAAILICHVPLRGSFVCSLFSYGLANSAV